jgi:spore coat polysaccharide biosynthesis predicted glycosyltransferase SpsG
LFHCDATADIGFGHLSRCVALAEALRLSRVNAVFAGHFNPAAKDQIAAAGFSSVAVPGLVNSGTADRDALRCAMEANAATLVIVDSYRADETYLADLRTLGVPTAVIDDFRALATYPCDLVLNFTWEAPALEYPDGPVLLLGPRYFPARRRLVELRSQSIGQDRSGLRNLLIAIGGSDPKRIAQRLIRLLGRHAAGIRLRVIAANDADLADPLDGFLPGSIVLPRQPDLSEQLLWADACITGGGLIKYESGFMGVPAAAVSQNEGQAGETRALTNAGLVFDLGLADGRSDEDLTSGLQVFLTDSALRAGLAARMREVFPPDPSAQAARAITEAIGR